MDDYCDRVLVVLTTGLTSYLWDNILKQEKFRQRSNGNSNIDSGFNFIEALEQLVKEMLQTLEIGKDRNAFRKTLEDKCAEMKRPEEDDMNEKKEEVVAEVKEKGKGEEKKPNAIEPLKKKWLPRSGENVSAQVKWTLHDNGKLIVQEMDKKNPVKREIDLAEAKAIRMEGNYEIIVEMPEKKWSFMCTTTSDRNEWLGLMTGTTI